MEEFSLISITLILFLALVFFSQQHVYAPTGNVIPNKVPSGINPSGGSIQKIKHVSVVILFPLNPPESPSQNVFRHCNSGVLKRPLPNCITVGEGLEFIQGPQVNGTVDGILYNLAGAIATISTDKINTVNSSRFVSSIEIDRPFIVADIIGDKLIRADRAWSANLDGSGVSVAVLDSGININPQNQQFNDVACFSLLTNSTDCVDDFGHGTHVAGIIAAAGINNHPELKGVAPGVKLNVIKIINSHGSTTLSLIEKGIDAAISPALKSQVINLSLEDRSPPSDTKKDCDSEFPALNDTMYRAVAAGTIVVAAAGNDHGPVRAPACLSKVIAVGAINYKYQLASFSNTGTPMKNHGLVAPGVMVRSTVPIGSPYFTTDSGILALNGTSMATPFVSGTVALMLQKGPNLTPEQVQTKLFTSACIDPSCPGVKPGIQFGFGAANAATALDDTPPTLSIVSPSNNTSTTPTVQVSGTASDNLSVQSVTWKLDDGTVRTANGTANWSFIIDSLPIGAHTIWFNATDSSGNVASEHIGLTIMIPHIPKWVKDNAKYWSDNAETVDDLTFAKGIQYMIQQGIITIPPTMNNQTNPGVAIPHNVKEGVGYWVTGGITDDTFVMYIQYLITKGFIRV